MAFFSLVVALMLEQARALHSANPVYGLFRRYVRLVESSLNAGRYQHGVVAWAVTVLPAVAAVGIVGAYLDHYAPPLAWLWNVGVLYLTMGFRQFSHHYTQILEALRAGDLAAARAALARWRGFGAEEFGAVDVAGVAIERGLIAAHRHVFGVVAWFVVFGPAGAVLYRQAAMLRENWGARTSAEEAEFSRFARTAFEVIDWLPVRMTALCFAVVGDFEDAVYCWRTQARSWPDTGHGIVLAAGAGALGVRLGTVLPGESVEPRPEIGMGEEPDAELMTSAVGLVWRVLVLWLFLILLVTVATWVG